MYPLRCLVPRRSRIAWNNAVQICLRRYAACLSYPALLSAEVQSREAVGQVSKGRTSTGRSLSEGLEDHEER